jgi:hypothetical protein
MTNSAPKTRLLLATVIAVCAAVPGISSRALAADVAETAAASTDNRVSTAHTANMDRAENPQSRIRHLHDQLQITPGEEAKWNAVAQVMLDNASTVDSAIKTRIQMTKGMTAIDDLKSYEAVVNAHAEGIKKLAIAFAPLYEAMPADQQKHADAVFGRRTGPAQVKTHA